MRLHVQHTSRYHFDDPVRGLIQSHRLHPAIFAGQSVIEWRVAMPGAVTGAAFRDSAGDLVETRSVRGPVSEVVIEVTGVVDTIDLFGVLKNHREKVPPLVYTTPTWLTQADSALTALAKDTLADTSSGSALERAHALSNAVADAVTYVAGTTEPDTTAGEALAGGKGVCQDHAHVLIAIAHLSDIPARYVTGYLLADAEGQVHDASHAWAELWVPDLGWVGFDAANRCCPDERYVRLGSGVDAVDAAPIRGVVQGGTSVERLDVEVVVTAGQQQQQ